MYFVFCLGQGVQLKSKRLCIPSTPTTCIIWTVPTKCLFICCPPPLPNEWRKVLIYSKKYSYKGLCFVNPQSSLNKHYVFRLLKLSPNFKEKWSKLKFNHHYIGCDCIKLFNIMSEIHDHRSLHNLCTHCPTLPTIYGILH